ncbi:hypothetical protein [Fimbriiglobus ruber]|uniref:Uncharacterized protein n=1 Tax=Fimbriiglobus ruber TaxID=1908690 RepID=A0A225EG10_9BACT|nr:hypothetical protein [Fimbriiglobus ruber]OWK47275.1 hypothetical protein FRUB_00974 [Fimbriiglobus ruber]
MRIATALLNQTELWVNGKPHRLVEVEAYYASPEHPDPFAHRDPVQLAVGPWYFHRTGGTYRGGSFKGLDLAFGGGSDYGGVLFRGLEKPDGSLVDGPSLLVDYLLREAGFRSVAELDRAIAGRLAWDGTQPLVLAPVRNPVDRPVFRTTRVGLTLKRRKPDEGDSAVGFLLRKYRYLTEPTRTMKGKPHMVLEQLASGASPEEIRLRTNCPLPAIARYAAAYAGGANESAFTPYYGRSWSTAEVCRLHGLGRVKGL